ncbi:MAG: DUF1656 domain-containing protein [Geminicoccaceae bacterium]
MVRELALGGLLVPMILVSFALSVALFVPLDILLGRYDIYRFTWHPALVRAAAFLVFWAVISGVWPG